MANHRSGVLLYLAFCRRVGVDAYNADYQALCAYVEYLTDYISAPSTIRNKISQVRVHLSLVEAPLDQVNHPRVSRALEALDRDKSYVPRVKSPLQAQHFYDILCNIEDDRLGAVIRAILLTIYYGALRQSELLPRTVKTWNPTTQPTMADLSLDDHTCTIMIKTGKNMQKIGQFREVVMERARNPVVCPVRAIQAVLYQNPLHPDAPIFSYPGTVVPVTAPKVTKTMHRIMYKIGLGQLVSKVSLHSIRKSAATDAFLAGCSETSIRQYGGWTSQAYRSYIATSNRAVNRVLIDTIGGSHAIYP